MTEVLSRRQHLQIFDVPKQAAEDFFLILLQELPIWIQWHMLLLLCTMSWFLGFIYVAFLRNLTNPTKPACGCRNGSKWKVPAIPFELQCFKRSYCFKLQCFVTPINPQIYSIMCGITAYLN